MIYLDLEETIIKSWNNPVFINEIKIRRYFKANNIKEIGIYSFAISNDKDREEFNSELKNSIENILNVKITKVLTVDEICKIINTNLVLHQFIIEYGKYFSFLKYCTVEHVNEFSVLIDDNVPDSVSFIGKTSIETININKLE